MGQPNNFPLQNNKIKNNASQLLDRLNPIVIEHYQKFPDEPNSQQPISKTQTTTETKTKNNCIAKYELRHRNSTFSVHRTR
jgi:hypothetical protein